MGKSGRCPVVASIFHLNPYRPSRCAGSRSSDLRQGLFKSLFLPFRNPLSHDFRLPVASDKIYGADAVFLRERHSIYQVWAAKEMVPVLRVFADGVGFNNEKSQEVIFL